LALYNSSFNLFLSQDDSTLNEIEDNRINHQLQTLDTLAGRVHKVQEEHVSAGAEAERLHVAAKEQGCDESEKAGDAGIIGAAAIKLDSAESKLVAVSDALWSHASSIMTASDIANQNVSDSTIIPSGLCAGASFVQSKNKVNSELNVLEDGKSANADCKPKLTTNSDDIVFRRQRNKKKRNNIPSDNMKVKRVSFHEDFIRNEHESFEKCGSEFSVSFLPPNSVIKRDAVKGRYSWCGEGDAPFVRKRNKESDTKSDMYLLSSDLTSYDEIICMEDPLARVDQNTGNISTLQKDECMVSETAHALPVTERGTPEGQEDPPNSASTLFLHRQGIEGILPEAVHRLSGNLKKFPSYSSSVDCSSDSESILCPDSEFVCSRTSHLLSSSFKEKCSLEKTGSLSLPDVRTSKLHSHYHNSQKGTPLGLIPSRDVASKRSLFNRFMRSVTEKKFMQKSRVVLKPSRSLYIPGARNLDRMEVLEHFKTELSAMGHDMERVHPETSELQETFRAHGVLNSEEVLYKVRNGFVSVSVSLDLPFFQIIIFSLLYMVISQTVCMSFYVSS
jgi:hypothetical protein